MGVKCWREGRGGEGVGIEGSRGGEGAVLISWLKTTECQS